eukprot:18169-Pelagococcus_subviridis.AAC.3
MNSSSDSRSATRNKSERFSVDVIPPGVFTPLIAPLPPPPFTPPPPPPALPASAHKFASKSPSESTFASDELRYTPVGFKSLSGARRPSGLLRPSAPPPPPLDAAYGTASALDGSHPGPDTISPPLPNVVGDGSGDESPPSADDGVAPPAAPSNPSRRILARNPLPTSPRAPSPSPSAWRFTRSAWSTGVFIDIARVAASPCRIARSMCARRRSASSSAAEDTA